MLAQGRGGGYGRRMDEDEIIATVRPGPARRWTAVGVLGALAAVLASTGLEQVLSDSGTAALAGAALIGVAALAGWGAVKVADVTGRTLVLTRRALSDDRGEVLAPLDAVARVDRGAFAFKPSSGFVIHTDRPLGWRWAPGLWWRFGQRVGVGGTLAARDARGMADVMTLILRERAGELDELSL